MTVPDIYEGSKRLDLFLSKQRCKIARRQIQSVPKNGRILDIGCGRYPLFLTTVDFSERYGLDRDLGTGENAKRDGITLVDHNIEEQNKMPFEDNYFDAVSMLAVFEHIEPNSLVAIHRDIYRILKPSGVYIMTTPAFWTDGLLRFLVKLRLLSDVSIDAHKGSYKYSDVFSILQKAHFEDGKLRFGYFELFMNLWVTATK
jgi:ubiquinone/menaquinone biosynthesis C-methylase UbiE